MRVLFIVTLTLVACKKDGGDPTPVDTDCSVTGFGDRDGDGFGDPQRETSACVEPVVSNADDCDDQDFFANPEADERCDGKDNDCDGLVDADDPDAEALVLFPDADGDGFGAGDGTRTCDEDPLAVEVGGDCDDDNLDIHPGVDEVCDGVDNDCDDLIDDDDPSATGVPVWYADADGDGFGGSQPVVACEQPAFTTVFSEDCDDSVATTYPGAPERCNGNDDDCDGGTDGAPFTPDTCGGFEGPWTGPYTVQLDDGTNTRTCTGAISVTIDRSQVPALQGTFTCDLDAAQGGWGLTQTGGVTGDVWKDGSLVGTIDAFEGVPRDWNGQITGTDQDDFAFTGQGTGLVVSGGAWDLSFSFDVDYQLLP